MRGHIAAGMAVVIAVAAVFANPGRAAVPPRGPSFDCAKASPIEATICQDTELSAADMRLAALYAAAKPGALGVGSNQRDSQRHWIRQRDKDCANGSWQARADKGQDVCLSDEYDDRLEALAVADLFVAPKESLAEIRRVNPKAAPIYQALFDYVTISDPVARTRSVETQITPIYAAMDSNTHDAFETAGGLASTPQAAARSDANFGRFFDLMGMLEDVRLTWPCAALVKRPGLVEGLGAFWGGAIDGAVPSSDCSDTLPPTPKLASLTRTMIDVQPPCGGTIVHSTGRNFAMLSDAVALDRAEVWRKTGRGRILPEADERAFRRRQAEAIKAAQAELTAYYIRNFQTPADAAATDAHTAIDAMISAAFNLCD